MSSSLNVSAIKSFVKNTLGCTCPDEVFNQIECKEEYNPGSNLTTQSDPLARSDDLNR